MVRGAGSCREWPDVPPASSASDGMYSSNDWPAAVGLFDEAGFLADGGRAFSWPRKGFLAGMGALSSSLNATDNILSTL